MDELRISLVQTNVIWENPSANRSRLEQLLHPLIGNSDVVLLPEMFTTGFSMNAIDLAEPLEGPTVCWMKQQAKLLGAAIAGSLIIKEELHFFNRFLFVAPTGELFHYDKKHLFSLGDENKYFEPGNRRMILNYLGWRIALFICYDLRFPVWLRSPENVDLMLFTANWPDSRKIVWQTLARARAIENQLYVAGVNRTGTDGCGIYYSGESMLIDAKGRIRCNLSDATEKVETQVVSLEELNRFRKKFPVSRDADSFEIVG